MPKGPRITPDVEGRIAEVYLEHKEWRAKEIQREVNTRLRRQNPHVDPGWPGLSAVQKELTKIRKREDARTPESKRLNEPWTTQSLIEYPISPEALPSVLQVWVHVRENKNKPFSIREAQWAGRLYATTKDIATLADFALANSLGERTTEITGHSFIGANSSIDLLLFSHMTGQTITPERESKIFAAIKSHWDRWKRGVEYLDKYGVGDMYDEGYTVEEIKQKIEEAQQNEGTHNQEG